MLSFRFFDLVMKTNLLLLRLRHYQHNHTFKILHLKSAETLTTNVAEKDSLNKSLPLKPMKVSMSAVA